MGLGLKLFRRRAAREAVNVERIVTGAERTGDVLASIEYELQQLKREIQPRPPRSAPAMFRAPFAPESGLRNPDHRRDPKWWKSLGFEG